MIRLGITFLLPKSRDGEENYPGTIDIWVTYTLDATGLVEIKYKAISDQKTIINPTNHAYFNLSGKFDQSIEDHVFWVNADSFLPMNENSIPTGEALFPVDGSRI
jgi:aldose 1-epimerase